MAEDTGGAAANGVIPSGAAAEGDSVTAEGIRERARREMIAAIKASAHEQIAAGGADGLSLRAITRDLEMSSSAIYRYFASRDELLTALVIDAYNHLGAAAEQALADAGSASPRAKWLAVCRSVRAWGLAHRHEYALIYGTPVAGYEAPEDTVAPAARVAMALTEVVLEAHRGGVLGDCEDPQSHAVRADTDRLQRELVGRGPAGRLDSEPSTADLPAGTVAALIATWAELFGLVTFELFGQFRGVVEAREEFFDHAAGRLAAEVGLRE